MVEEEVADEQAGEVDPGFDIAQQFLGASVRLVNGQDGGVNVVGPAPVFKGEHDDHQHHSAKAGQENRPCPQHQT